MAASESSRWCLALPATAAGSGRGARAIAPASASISRDRPGAIGLLRLDARALDRRRPLVAVGSDQAAELVERHRHGRIALLAQAILHLGIGQGSSDRLVEML